MATGQTAGLLEYVTDDSEYPRTLPESELRVTVRQVFTISIGHIPPYAVLETHLVVRSVPRACLTQRSPR